MQRVKSWRLPIVLVALATIAYVGWTYGPWLMYPPLKWSMSSRGTSILKGATRVEVFRVSPEESQHRIGEEIGGYPITAKGKERGQEFASRLTATLLGSGVTQNAKKCGLQPGVAFRVWKGKEAVEVLICFKCDVLWAYVVGEKSEKPWFEWQDFDPVRADLLRLAREAFPEDNEVQGLPEVRSH